MFRMLPPLPPDWDRSSTGPYRPRDASGRMVQTVVVCIDADEPEVLEPVRFYRADRVHLLYSVPGTLGPRAVGDLLRILPSHCYGAEVRRHVVDIRDTRSMLGELLKIADEESRVTKGLSDIRVDLSSGTQEFAAAGAAACVLCPELNPFTVRPEGYGADEEKIGRMLYGEGRPSGLSKAVGPPVYVPMGLPGREDSALAVSLCALSGILAKGKRAPYSVFVGRLKDAGMWNYVPEPGTVRTDQKERIHFRRHYIVPMLKRGWISEDPEMKRRFVLTDRGRDVVSVYGV